MNQIQGVAPTPEVTVKHVNPLTGRLDNITEQAIAQDFTPPSTQGFNGTAANLLTANTSNPFADFNSMVVGSQLRDAQEQEQAYQHQIQQQAANEHKAALLKNKRDDVATHSQFFGLFATDSAFQKAAKEHGINADSYTPELAKSFMSNYFSNKQKIASENRAEKHARNRLDYSNNLNKAEKLKQYVSMASTPLGKFINMSPKDGVAVREGNAKTYQNAIASDKPILYNGVFYDVSSNGDVSQRTDGELLASDPSLYVTAESLTTHSKQLNANPFSDKIMNMKVNSSLLTKPAYQKKIQYAIDNDESGVDKGLLSDEVRKAINMSHGKISVKEIVNSASNRLSTQHDNGLGELSSPLGHGEVEIGGARYNVDDRASMQQALANYYQSNGFPKIIDARKQAIKAMRNQSTLDAISATNTQDGATKLVNDISNTASNLYHQAGNFLLGNSNVPNPNAPLLK